MPALSPNICEAVHAACKTGAQEVAEAFSRALDRSITLQVEAPDRIARNQLPSELNGPGLLILLYVEERAALVLLPESNEFLPSWYRVPDATGQSKLSTLAQELGMLLLPDDCAAERFEWRPAVNLARSLTLAGVGEGAAMISLPATSEDGQRGVVRLIWPANTPEKALQAAASAETPLCHPDTADREAGGPASPAPSPRRRPKTRSATLRELPIYSRSLLRVKVPVVVTLARKRQPVSRIVELGPGCIIQFDKSCEEMLDLYLGGRMIANGEAVKVGDKFGLRITNVVLPEERFQPLKKA